MLTKKDKEWLEKRERVLVANDLYSCAHCAQYSDIYSVWTGYCAAIEPFECGIRANYRDAAEFEARVAAKLSRMDWEDVPCAHGMSLFCPKKGGPHINCGAWCLMREARLAVEAEMEQEGK